MNTTKNKYHTHLANYFQSQPLYLDDKEVEKQNIRKLIELPWQQTKAEMWDEVSNTLCDLYYIQAKVSADMVYKLEQDYKFVFKQMPFLKNKHLLHQKELNELSQWKDKTIQFAELIENQFGLYWLSDDAMEECNAVDELNITWIAIKSTLPSISQNTDLINNNRIANKLSLYYSFLLSNLHGFAKFYFKKNLVFQQAYNYSKNSDISASAEKIIESGKLKDHKNGLLLFFPSHRQNYNANPFIIRTIADTGGQTGTSRLTADAQFIFTGFDNGIIKKIDFENGKCVYQYNTGTDILHFDISADGRKVFISTRKNELYVYDTEIEMVYTRLPSPNSSIIKVKVNANGTIGFSLGRDNIIRVWNFMLSKEIRQLHHQGATIEDFDITPCGVLAVGGMQNHTVCVWDVLNGKEIHVFNDYLYLDSFIRSITIGPDGKSIICSGAVGGIARVDRLSGYITGSHPDVNTWEAQLMCITSDSRIALTYHTDHHLKVWDIEHLSLLKSVKLPFEVKSLSVTATGKKAIVTDSLGVISILDIENGKNEDINSQSLFGANLAAISDSGEKGISGGKMKTIDIKKNKINDINCAEFVPDCADISPDGKKIALAQEYVKTLMFVDFDSTNLVHQVSEDKGISSMKFSSDNNKLITIGVKHGLKIWHIGKMLPEDIPVINMSPYLFCLSPEERYLFGALYNFGFVLVDLARKKIIKTIQHPEAEISSMTFLPDGKCVATGGTDKVIRLWSLVDFQIIKTFIAQETKITHITVSPDGRKLYSLNFDRNIYGWDIRTQQLHSICFNHNAGFSAISGMSKSGNFLSCTENETPVMFNVNNDFNSLPVVTIKRKWIDDKRNLFSFLGQKGSWDPEYSFHCPVCQNSSAAGEKIINTIRSVNQNSFIGPNDSPCIKLPDEAWKEPKLLSECPKCSGKIKLNPFIVDNKGFWESF